MKSDLNEVDFFHQLLGKTAEAYKQAEVYKKCAGWSYAVCATPISRRRGLILGLNWGGGAKTDYPPQSTYPDGTDIETYPFFRSLKSFLDGRLNIENINYSNLCFFRSPKVSDLKPGDWEKSAQLIKSFIEYIQPAWILLASTQIQYAEKVLEINYQEFQAGEKKVFKAFKGICQVNGQTIPFYAVPHPGSRIEGRKRLELWNQILPPTRHPA